MTREEAKEIVKKIYEEQIKDEFQLAIGDGVYTKIDEAFNMAIEVLEQEPKTEEHKVGKWIKYNTTEKFDFFGDRVKVSSYECSECGRIISDIGEDVFTNKLQDYPYCHCGAKMEREK